MVSLLTLDQSFGVRIPVSQLSLNRHCKHSYINSLQSARVTLMAFVRNHAGRQLPAANLAEKNEPRMQTN